MVLSQIPSFLTSSWLPPVYPTAVNRTSSSVAALHNSQYSLKVDRQYRPGTNNGACTADPLDSCGREIALQVGEQKSLSSSNLTEINSVKPTDVHWMQLEWRPSAYLRRVIQAFVQDVPASRYVLLSILLDMNTELHFDIKRYRPLTRVMRWFNPVTVPCCAVQCSLSVCRYTATVLTTLELKCPQYSPLLALCFLAECRKSLQQFCYRMTR